MGSVGGGQGHGRVDVYHCGAELSTTVSRYRDMTMVICLPRDGAVATERADGKKKDIGYLRVGNVYMQRARVGEC
jgi:hypothetical protein